MGSNEIEWPDHWDENQINKIFVDSISSIVEGNLSTKTIEFKEFFSKFSHERAKSQQKPLNTYYYLTRLSINQPNTDYIINIQNHSIVFGPTAHDKFYGTEFEGNFRTVSVRDPSLYCPLYVKIRSKSHTEAADASQRVLYAFMGFLNGITSYYAHNFGSHKSLHRIRPSKYQIIADNKKRLITDVWWYSPYEEDEIFPLKVSEPAINIAKKFFHNIQKSNIEDDLISSLHLIHQAGAELNGGLRILLIWNAIEVLFSSYNSQENTKTIIHRASFMSETPHFRKIKLNLLNRMRNRYAHKAKLSINSDALFFDSRNYLIQIIRTIGEKKWSKMTLKDIHAILDHSLDANSINNSIKNAKIALSLRR
ncbi:hypothetical protein [Neoroseomonas lacus]|uniref:Apea-like HEPN domain-containing protein n=1 Tax=Neoroseomonas lacus TaxID=287609 RepID=A0A917L0T3_9PROT|nr:hypothetical protein [Neoroseomonas lacus]GGJ36548.1 hypothetical protein GCM10011320_50420 [Neoroseomonas lacus]